MRGVAKMLGCLYMHRVHVTKTPQNIGPLNYSYVWCRSRVCTRLHHQSLVTLTSATSGRSHLRSADSLTFDIARTRTIVHSRSLVHAPGTHFLLTYVVHQASTLLRSVSNHICFLLLTSYNNFFYLSNCLLLCILCTVIICTVLATSLCKHFLY